MSGNYLDMLGQNQNLELAWMAVQNQKYRTAIQHLNTLYHQTITDVQNHRKVSDTFLETMMKGLELTEIVLEIPELEPTDHIVGVLAEKTAALMAWSKGDVIDGKSVKTLSKFHSLLQDLHVLLKYMEHYFGQLGQNRYPVITAGIEAAGRYGFYENHYNSTKTGLSLTIRSASNG